MLLLLLLLLLLLRVDCTVESIRKSKSKRPARAATRRSKSWTLVSVDTLKQGDYTVARVYFNAPRRTQAV